VTDDDDGNTKKVIYQIL